MYEWSGAVYGICRRRSVAPFPDLSLSPNGLAGASASAAARQSYDPLFSHRGNIPAAFYSGYKPPAVPPTARWDSNGIALK